jgi:plastocyanin
MSRCLKRASSLALVAALILPGAAHAATRDVSLGPTPTDAKALRVAPVDVNDFFPHRVTIHAGDTVRFLASNFHTVDLPGSRTKKLPLVTPLGPPPISAVADAAGAAFWFNNQPRLGFNPTLLASSFGKSKTYSGARAVLSGLPFANKPKPMSVRFTRAGTFRYFCDVHLGMTGVVRVVSSARPIPSATANRRTVRRQIAAAVTRAKALAKAAAPPANTVDVGRQAAGGVSLFAFVPNQLTVPRGTTVTFRENARTETHTATIGPGDPEKEPTSYLGQVAAGFAQPVIDPRAIFPSDPPGTLAALTPIFHGNGFWNSGALDSDASTPTVPQTNAVTFADPGTYQAYCMIHPFMHATVTVT